jgi:hypothetical protein
MIDIISLVIALGSLAVAVLSHIRHSECFGVKIDTRTPLKQTPPSTPGILECQPLLQHSPAVMEATEPIDIPLRPKMKKNYL